MFISSLLILGGLAVCGLIGHWTIYPVPHNNPFGI